MKKILLLIYICSWLLSGLANAETATDSPFRRAGDLVYISSQLAINPKTGAIIDDKAKDQVNQIFQNMRRVAEQAGGNLNDIVKLNVYMTNIHKIFPVVKNSIPTYFKPPYPSRSPVGGVKLGKHMLLAIDAVMYLPRNK